MKQMFISLLILTISLALCHAQNPEQTSESKYIINAEKLLQQIASVIRPGETSLENLIPEYWITDHSKMNWDQALDHANKTYMDKQPERALFLWTKLYPEQPAIEVNKLKIGTINWIPGGRHYQRIEMIIPDENNNSRSPEVVISTYIQGNNRIIDPETQIKHLELESSIIVGPTRLVFHDVKCQNIEFTEIAFNTYHNLHSFKTEKHLLNDTGEKRIIMIKADMVRRLTNACYFITESDEFGKIKNKREYDKDLKHISN